MSDDAFRQYHDLGGLDRGAVSPDTHEIALWEKRIESMVRLLSMRDPPLITVDEMRRGIEELPPELYDTLSYYERWIASLTAILVEKGVLDADELKARADAVAEKKGAAA